MATSEKWWGRRVVTEFTFPEAIAELAGHKTVGFVAPTWEDEERATQIGGDSAMRSRNQLIRYSVATIDRHAVEQDGAEVQALFSSDPKVRILLMQAWLTVSSPSESDLRGFTESRKIVVE